MGRASYLGKGKHKYPVPVVGVSLNVQVTTRGKVTDRRMD